MVSETALRICTSSGIRADSASFPKYILSFLFFRCSFAGVLFLKAAEDCFTSATALTAERSILDRARQIIPNENKLRPNKADEICTEKVLLCVCDNLYRYSDISCLISKFCSADKLPTEAKTRCGFRRRSFSKFNICVEWRLVCATIDADSGGSSIRSIRLVARWVLRAKLEMRRRCASRNAIERLNY